MTSSPQVSVLVLTCNGLEHLRTCLPTLAVQTYPRDRFHTEVLVNGSTDGSIEFLRSQYPDVIVHPFERNFGFATPYDRVIRQCDSAYVALLNDDTRVEPTWLAELVAAADRHGAHAVASRILDWDGQRIDFVGGLVTFLGHSWQRDISEPAGREYDEVPLLFACGGSMLVSREAYLDAGGLDEDFFAYFEDVDLGWRLSLLGYRTVLAPRAITYHRLHGTHGKIAFAQRLRLYERNALMMLYKNYGDETLRRVLPAAISLSLARGLAHTGIDPRTFALGSTPPAGLDIPARTVAHLLALEDFCRLLPALNVKRADIQGRRKVSDDQIIALFGGDPFRLHEGGRYEEIARTLIRDFEIERAFHDPQGPPTTLRSALRTDASDHTPTAPPQYVGPTELRSAERADTPLVSVIVLTVLGATHLPDCLASLRAQTYPADRYEVIVVDNASAEDPTACVSRCYPGARVIRNPTNIGFAAGNNVGAQAAHGEYVAFLNDDTRVHPDWIRELVGTAVRHQAASVASRILSWDGTTIDFVGGSVNCEGRGFQIDFGFPESGRHSTECPLLFPCGGAMLVRRDVFLETGGWDEGAFAYYEDLELGWRLWLLGHEVWYSPKAVMFHKHHGTWGGWPEPPRLRLYERNSLRMLYTLLEQETLERVLPAALLLSIDRALLATELSRAARGTQEIAEDAARRRGRTVGRLTRMKERAKEALRSRGANRQRSLAENWRRLGASGLWDAARETLSGTASRITGSRRAAFQIERGANPLALDGHTEYIPISAAAALSGVYDFLNELPQLSERRQRLQSARRRSDREILSRFDVHWVSPTVSPHQLEHNAVHRDVIESLGIADLARPDGQDQGLTWRNGDMEELP